MQPPKPTYEELERRLAEAERRLAEVGPATPENFLQAVLDNLSSHVCVIDHTGMVLSVNRAWKNFAVPNEWRGEGFGVHSNYLEVCDAATGACAEGAAESAKGIRGVLTGTLDHFYMEYPCHGPNEQRWFEMRVTRIDADPSPLCLIAHENITERKRAETQLRLSQKHEAIATLAGGIAHDFNNILAAILGYTELIREDVADGTPIAEDLDRIHKSGVRARDLVGQLLTFSRMTETSRRPLEMGPVVKECMKLLGAAIPKSIRIQLNIDPELPRISADLSQMQQLIMNLCTNAYEAIGENEGEIRVSLHPIKLDAIQGHLERLRPGPYLELLVEDDGPGIAPEIRERVFDPFFTTKEQGKGTGMGLATVHDIVENHGGKISASNGDKRGAQFRVLIPAAAAAEPHAEGAADKPPTGKGRVLIIDDEKDIADVLRRQLSVLGYDTFALTSSQEALDYVLKHATTFDVIITDQQMPGVLGRELAATVHERHPEIPIIVMTGHSETVTRRNYASLGFFGFVSKPISLKELGTIVSAAIASRLDSAVENN
ncbi:MAG: response regulator [Candidatus Hydrogenedens sp.]|nr:response regulator [Candidatus Hydrogenedens sp.]